MQINKQIYLILLLVVILTSVGCSNSGRYKLKDDTAPSNSPDVSLVESAHPKYEPYSRGGNRDYTVRGKSYSVLKSGKDFKATGTASWYGAKFHGHLTSNGEVYDMYSMSAAHKTLPLPSFAKVTNLTNNKQVIVRVNDRGPFHGNRILDVSYAAAHHLGMLSTGTAKISMEVIHFPSPTELALNNSAQYIQVIASADQAKVNRLSATLAQKYQIKTRVQVVNNLFRLQLGPISQQGLIEQLLAKIQNQGYPQSYIVDEAPKG